MQHNIPFTEEMKKEYTILVPTMLTMHFKMMTRFLRANGYNVEILKNDGPGVMAEGLKYVHNDTCVPALLVIGQFIDALHSGKYDLNKVALAITQTGGGCRASNYIFLLRKALKKAGLEHIHIRREEMVVVCVRHNTRLNIHKIKSVKRHMHVRIRRKVNKKLAVDERL